MPEGHAIRRQAREHVARFAGVPVQLSSPQGRFAEGAALLDGRVLEGTKLTARMLKDRLEDKIEVDFDTARRLFTLICVLHIRG